MRQARYKENVVDCYVREIISKYFLVLGHVSEKHEILPVNIEFDNSCEMPRTPIDMRRTTP